VKSKPLVYEPDENHRRKHRGDEPEARLTEDDTGNLVGKCSSEIDVDVAQRLLDEGIHWSPRTHRSPYPKYVYNVHKGVPYRAHRRGQAYHGFPDVKNRIPTTVRDDLRRRAEARDELAVFDLWMQTTEKYT
jgi:hypothetical protein